MQVIERDLSSIRPYENNPRQNDAAVQYVANSIKEFGWKQPIVIDKDGVIIAGHTRWKAAKKLGMKTAPCIMADDLTDEQVRAYRLADNKVAEMADWDFTALEEELAGIEDIDMSEFGFYESEIEFPDKLDDDVGIDEKTVVRLVFQDYKSYSKYEREIKEFAEKIEASLTVGK